MAENVVRQDVVQIEFDTNLNTLKELTSGLDDVKKSVSGIGKEDGLDKIKDQAKKAKGETDKLGDSGEKTKSTFQKFKDVNMEKLKNGLKKIDDKLGSIAKKAGGSALNALKKMAGLTFKGLAVGLGASATAIGAIVKSSVSAYADYEQLVGGVDTLFKGSSKIVQSYANDAYKTAGLSANQYMETVTSFSASLLQSLGGDTKKAAQYSNRAIIDMSDNANKMGTDMSMIQNAYQGFAKQNYTMLDNLKLGYGGTKEEMERLIKDASAMTDVQKKLGITVDSNSMSFGNIVNAISVMQEKMGIAGTTSKEASSTISGSLASMKSAWSNLMPALIQGGDQFDQCVDNLIDSIVGVEDETGKRVGGVIANLKPAITKAIQGAGELVTELAPIIEAEFPQLAKDLLPPLIEATVSLAKGLISALPTIIKTIAESIVDIFGEQFPIVQKIGDFFKENADSISGAIKKIVPVVIALAGAFKLFNGVKSITSLFGGKGKGGSGEGGGFFSGLTTTFKELAKTKPTTILKGMANLGIIIGGFVIIAAALMALAPYMAQLTDAKSMIELVVVIGVLGLVGTGLAQLAGIVGKIPVATVAKGLANIAIIIAGMSALFLLIGAVSLIDFDYAKILQIALIIGVLGTVGSALSLFAGIVGMIPIPVVLAGLANIALVLGGMTALILAFGKLSEAKGFNEFIEKGGETLAKIFNVIGKIGGSLVGGLGEGISNSLPAIGKNLGAFGKNVKPLFDAMKGVDMGGVGTFFTSLVGLLGLATGNEIIEGIKSFFGGGEESSLEKLGTQLTNFATNAKGFFTAVQDIKDESFGKATKFFECFAGLSSLPKEGGLWGAIAGGETTALTNLATTLCGLAEKGEGIKSFFNMVSGIPETAFTNAPKFFQALSGISKLPKEGGLWDKLTGEETTTLGSLATALGQFGEKTASFFTQINSLNLDNLNGLWESLKTSSTISTDVLKIVETNLNDIVTKCTELPAKVGPQMILAGSQMINGLVIGMNSKRELAVSTARSIANAINAEYRKIQDINSPSGVWESFGEFQILGDVRGMKNKLPLLKKTVQGVGETSLPYSGNYTPESSVSTISSTRSSETNHYSPQFNLTISGTGDDRATARKVKQWVAEAMEEAFASLESKNRRLREV